MKEPFKPTQRFSGVVDAYVRYRPRYPARVIQILKQECNLQTNHKIADIGSGTGIFTQLLLEHGYAVSGVEPNKKMREAAENLLLTYPKFLSVGGSSEHSHLAGHSIDMITVAQAFHWFDPVLAKKEFLRILKKKGWLVLLWNLRPSRTEGIMAAYETLLQTYGADYKDVCAEGVTDDSVQHFFSPSTAKIFVLPHEQLFDWEDLQERLLSTSYVPKQGEENFDAMLIQAKKIFDEHQQDGRVTFLYETKIYIGQF